MENPKVMIPATMETFRFMDLRGWVEGRIEGRDQGRRWPGQTKK